MKLEFRTLKASEIECRVQQVTEKGYILLLYKDARVDQNLLDETVGAMQWQRDHKELKNNMYSGIGIYDSEFQHWVWKWDCGSESNTEKEKGEASDSFKRAGFNWGIGRELYTSPFIWVIAQSGETEQYNGKPKLNNKVKFSVKSISYNENREINGLIIVDQTGKVRFEMGKPSSQQQTQTQPTVNAPVTVIENNDEAPMSTSNDPEDINKDTVIDNINGISDKQIKFIWANMSDKGYKTKEQKKDLLTSLFEKKDISAVSSKEWTKDDVKAVKKALGIN